jgi:hypothetical protein
LFGDMGLGIGVAFIPTGVVPIDRVPLVITPPLLELRVFPAAAFCKFPTAEAKLAPALPLVNVPLPPTLRPTPLPPPA